MLAAIAMLILAEVTTHWQSSNPIHQQITRLLHTLSPSLMGMAPNRIKENTQILFYPQND